jgi:hypothetical protein
MVDAWYIQACEKRNVTAEYIDQQIKVFANEWQEIEKEYAAITEKIFGMNLVDDITVYLTLSPRCSYLIEHNLFYMTLFTKEAKRICMHELWHFYTYYVFGGEAEIERLGQIKYYKLTESLTVLLNIECKELLGEGIIDTGYELHSEVRTKVLELWTQKKDIRFVWEELVRLY